MCHTFEFVPPKFLHQDKAQLMINQLTYVSFLPHPCSLFWSFIKSCQFSPMEFSITVLNSLPDPPSSTLIKSTIRSSQGCYNYLLIELPPSRLSVMQSITYYTAWLIFLKWYFVPIRPGLKICSYLYKTSLILEPQIQNIHKLAATSFHSKSTERLVH